MNLSERIADCLDRYPDDEEGGYVEWAEELRVLADLAVVELAVNATTKRHVDLYGSEFIRVTREGVTPLNPSKVQLIFLEQ